MTIVLSVVISLLALILFAWGIYNYSSQLKPSFVKSDYSNEVADVKEADCEVQLMAINQAAKSGDNLRMSEQDSNKSAREDSFVHTNMYIQTNPHQACSSDELQIQMQSEPVACFYSCFK